MNTNHTILLTKRGMKDLKKTIARLEQDRLKVIAELRTSEKTTDHESRLERAEKLAALEVVEADLADKLLVLANAKLVPSRRARLQVAIGSVVDLIDSSGRLLRYTIVDSFEADPSKGKISIVSPLGSNLIGKTVQDIVVWSSELRTGTVRVVGIS